MDSITLAVIDKKGRAIIDQTINGSFTDPEMGKINVVGTLLGAVINVFKSIAGNNCMPFYTGSIEHPAQ